MLSIGICINCPNKKKNHIETKRSSQKGSFDKQNKWNGKKFRYSGRRSGQRFSRLPKFRRLYYHQNKSVNENYKEYKKSLKRDSRYMSNRANPDYKCQPHYAFPQVFYKALQENALNQKQFLKKPLYELKRKVFYFPPPRITQIEISIFADLENPYF